MNLRLISILLSTFILSSAILFAQNKINISDENGLKQGKWIKYFFDDKQKILYEGEFLNNKPIGEFKRYYRSGKLVSILTHSIINDSVNAVLYYSNGFKAASGYYIKKKKIGNWEYFSEKNKDVLICRETYTDSNEAYSTKYHTNGNKAEELIYKNDVKNGGWIQYYFDGIVCIKSKYVNGKISGKFETFHSSSSKEIVGTYKDDVRVGDWKFYTENGSLKKTIKYINGIASNESELIREETEYLDMLEKNKGKIKDPAKTEVLW